MEKRLRVELRSDLCGCRGQKFKSPGLGARSRCGSGKTQQQREWKRGLGGRGCPPGPARSPRSCPVSPVLPGVPSPARCPPVLPGVPRPVPGSLPTPGPLRAWESLAGKRQEASAGISAHPVFYGGVNFYISGVISSEAVKSRFK